MSHDFAAIAQQISTKTRSKLSALVVSLIAASMLSACVTVLVASAVVATVDVIHDRRTVGEYIDDSGIEITAANIMVSSPEFRKAAHVKPVAWNGILLITGEIDDENIKQQLVGKFSAIQGVRQVVDETTVTGKTKLLARSSDAWITSKVKSRLLLNTGLDANRIKVITTRGSVYLMGIVTETEAQSATELARTIRGVARVVKVFEYKES
ncbi:MAG: osmotically-inducible protein OsmY [Cryomorphaceae bacterium]|jgi:osmotically-inducible protein OsmY